MISMSCPRYFHARTTDLTYLQITSAMCDGLEQYGSNQCLCPAANVVLRIKVRGVSIYTISVTPQGSEVTVVSDVQIQALRGTHVTEAMTQPLIDALMNV